ncbi:MAG: hypothetical protein GVY20_07115 [Bacteroidetes bacterium]|jgi:hypothetical protein|nr:hypothetical protein [Bacteroidota bacterium]
MKFKKVLISTIFVIAAQTATAQIPDMPPQGEAKIKSMTSEILGVERGYSIYLTRLPVTLNSEGMFDVI